MDCLFSDVRFELRNEMKTGKSRPHSLQFKFK